MVQVRDLHVAFMDRGGLEEAVHGISFDIADGEIVAVSSRRGEMTARADVSDLTNKGEVWMAFHYLDNCNLLTIDALDNICSTPEYKACAVKVSKIAQ